MKYYLKLKIGTRLIAVIVLAVIIVAVAAVAVSVFGVTGYNNDENKNYVNKTMGALNNKLNDYKDFAMQNALLIAGNPDIVDAVESKNTAVILKALTTLTGKSNIDFITVTDKNGKVLARSHDPKTFGDSVLNQINVQMALKDTPLSAIESGTAVKLSARAGVPIKNESGEIIGVISTGYKLDNFKIVDDLKSLYGNEFTIFLNDERVSTTIISDGKRAIGTKLNPAVAEKVLTNGEAYNGNASILGTDYICAYMPLKGSDGKPIGVLFSGKSLSDSQKLVSDVIFSALIITLILVIITIIASYLFIRRNVIKPLSMITDSAEKLAIGDISAAENIRYVKKDEIGLLSNSFSRIVENIANQTKMVEKVSQGDLDVKVEVLSEKDVLSKSMNTMVETIKALVSETEQLTQAGVEGELTKRGRADRFSGSYREIIEGFNKMLDAMQVPMDYAFQFIERMANGEDLEEIDNIYKGYFNVLMSNLTKVRTSLYKLVNESVKCAKAAVNGELTVRGDISNIKGSYVSILGGFNEAFDAFLRPVNEAITVLSKMAVNDYTLDIKGNYYGMMAQFAEAINEVRRRLLSVQDVIERTSKGDLSRLDELTKVGRRSENDIIVPAVLRMMNNIKYLIEEVSSLTQAASNGNLGVRGHAENFEGGYKIIVEGINNTLDAVVNPLNEAIHVINAMSSNDFTSKMTGNYEGSFLLLSEAINNVQKTLNKVLGDLNVAAEQVASGSVQVSQGSQSLSQGSTEQASSIEELTSTITQIAVQTKRNAENASQANELAVIAKDNAIQGNQQMKAMLRSMEEINESSGNISKIIKVIDEIAFQTNILALNAAVEAARAGQHGKGFAVVAEEVRNLAARSADAAKETTSLIEGSIKKVEDGTKIANETADALTMIVEGVTKASNLVASIATASNEQATGIAQINQGITQVSAVTQTNSATAQESAAASEELSSQAELLKEMVSKFTLSKAVQSTNGYEDFNPEIIKMLEEISHKKKLTAAKETKKVKNESEKKPKITLSDSDYGKY